MSFNFLSAWRDHGVFGAATLPIGKTTRRFLCVDTTGGRVAVVAGDGKIGWEHLCERPRDCWGTPDGNVFFSYAGGVMEKLDDGRILWEYVAESGSEVSSGQPLPNGHYLVAENGPCRLVEVDTFGNVAKEIRLMAPDPALEIEVADRLRGARRSADGRYLVCRKGERVVEELSAEGKSTRRIPVAGDPHMAVRLANGNILIALGAAKKLQELDGELKVIWELGENDVRGNPLRFVSGFQRLPNGNTIVCNDLPAGFVGRQPQLFEITPDKKVLWEFTGTGDFKGINQVQVLGEPGDGTKEPALR